MCKISCPCLTLAYITSWHSNLLYPSILLGRRIGCHTAGTCYSYSREKQAIHTNTVWRSGAREGMQTALYFQKLLINGPRTPRLKTRSLHQWKVWRCSEMHLVVVCWWQIPCCLPTCPVPKPWLENWNSLLSGRDFIRVVKVRGNLLPTSLQCSRGRPECNWECDCCGNRAEWSHSPGLSTHLGSKNISKYIAQFQPKLRESFEKGDSIIIHCSGRTVHTNWRWTTKTRFNLWKRRNVAFIVDVTVVTDHLPLYEQHSRKVRYYKTSVLQKFAEAKFPCANIALDSYFSKWPTIYKSKSFTSLL